MTDEADGLTDHNFTHARFPSHVTWFLVGVLIIFTIVEWVGFLVLGVLLISRVYLCIILSSLRDRHWVTYNGELTGWRPRRSRILPILRRPCIRFCDH